MTGNEEERAFSGLVGIAFIAGAATLVIGGFFLFQSRGGTETTTTIAAAPEATTTTVPSTTTTEAVTTTTAPTTTTTELEEDLNPFVGWWKATDVDGSHLDLRIDAEGGFMYWDSASGVCEARGMSHSPQTWVGSVAPVVEGGPIITASGLRRCYPYGADNSDLGEGSADFLYDNETDMLAFAPDGVLYERSPRPPVAGDSNPFVGSWEATDSDGTRVTMSIHADGAWESEDTRSGGCERKGFTYATWSAAGDGSFDLTGEPSYQVVMNTFCHPPESGAVLHSPDVTFNFIYQPATDTVALRLFVDTIYTRVP